MPLLTKKVVYVQNVVMEVITRVEKMGVDIVKNVNNYVKNVIKMDVLHVNGDN